MDEITKNIASATFYQTGACCCKAVFVKRKKKKAGEEVEKIQLTS